MNWAMTQCYRHDNPTGDAIAAALPKRAIHVRHMPALPHGEVAGTIDAVNASSAWTGTKLCFELMVLTAARSAEVRLATWSEVNTMERVWPHQAAAAVANTRAHRAEQRARADLEALVETCLGGVAVFDAASGAPLSLNRRRGASWRGWTCRTARPSGCVRRWRHARSCPARPVAPCVLRRS